MRFGECRGRRVLKERLRFFVLVQPLLNGKIVMKILKMVLIGFGVLCSSFLGGENRNVSEKVNE